MQFDGIYTPIVTPYFGDFSIDQNVLCDVIDFLIEAGVSGLIVAGTTGEYYAQTSEERCDLLRLAKEHIAGRVPLIVAQGRSEPKTVSSMPLLRAMSAQMPF